MDKDGADSRAAERIFVRLGKNFGKNLAVTTPSRYEPEGGNSVVRHVIIENFTNTRGREG